MMFICAICGMQCSRLKQHVNSKHVLSFEEYVKTFISGVVYCHFCGFKTEWSIRFKRFKRFCNDSCRASFFNTRQYPWRKARLAEGLSRKWQDGVYRDKMSQKAKHDVVRALAGWKRKYANDLEFARQHKYRLLMLAKNRDTEAPSQKLCPYQGYTLRSSYELEFARWLDENTIAWEYQPKSFVFDDNRVYGYTPDFWLPTLDVFVEVKSTYWISESTHERIARVTDAGYNILLIHEKNWKDILSFLLSTVKN